MKITEHFIREEFDCHDGTLYPPQWIVSRLQPLCLALERVRLLTDKPIHISSGYRTPTWNKSVGGKSKSMHLHGKAADIQQGGMTPKQLYDAVEQLIREKEISQGGLGLYPRFVHYDQRGYKARWKG